MTPMADMPDDAPRIQDALCQIDGLTVTTAWPREPSQGPVALVTLAGDSPADYRDGRRYLTELEYYVRVFAAKAAVMRAMCAAVNQAMEGLGYERTFRWEEPGEGWRQTAMRYKIYL